MSASLDRIIKKGLWDGVIWAASWISVQSDVRRYHEMYNEKKWNALVIICSYSTKKESEMQLFSHTFLFLNKKDKNYIGLKGSE